MSLSRSAWAGALVQVLSSLSALAVLGAPGACGGSSSTFGPYGASKEPVLPDAQAVNGPPLDLEGGLNGFSACVTSTRAAELSGVNLIFVYDKSGSMGDPAEGGDPNVKWIPLERGMEAFISDAASSWIRASLAFFPAPGDLATTCGFGYQTPAVALAPLSSGALLASIQATMPQGGTPTLPALEGGIVYAQSVAVSDPNDKTAVVLVTDGEPGFYIEGQTSPGCPGNDVVHVAEAAAAAYGGIVAPGGGVAWEAGVSTDAASPGARASSVGSIPTYVIGVGGDIDRRNADMIAAAGGTSQAFMVAVNDPAGTASSFASALASIRTNSFSCTIPFPVAPAGKTIDPGKVNLVLTSASGTQEIVPADPSCSTGIGWSYDNPASPTALTLCPATCSTVRDGGAHIALAFGCLTTSVLR